MKRKVYCQPRIKRATKAFEREELALVYVSEKADRADNRNLAIGRYTYFPNGHLPKDGISRFYKCSKHKCNARAIIKLEDLNKLGVRTVRVKNEHNHPPRDHRRGLDMIEEDLLTEEDETMMSRLLAEESGSGEAEPQENVATPEEDDKAEE